MSVPFTTRFDEPTVDALNAAVAAGLAPNKGFIVNEAVRFWLATHREEAIVASYRAGYADTPADDDLIAAIAAIGAFSAAACLADS